MLKLKNIYINQGRFSPRSSAHASSAWTHAVYGGKTTTKTVYSENYKPIRHEDVDREITDKGNGSE